MSEKDEIVLSPIGVIHTDAKGPEGVPIQPVFGDKDSLGRAEVFVEYKDGLKDLDGFSHIVLIYSFHLSRGFSLTVVPFMDETERGLFSTRAPRRPNPIGISVVELVGVEENIVSFRGPDMVDGTPLLDIKPHVPDFDSPGSTRIGWLKGRIGSRPRADDRFVD
jgi:tRNA-Thr(GGU) m(6)t(6)A37 methyltransferase TsaA